MKHKIAVIVLIAISYGCEGRKDSSPLTLGRGAGLAYTEGMTISQLCELVGYDSVLLQGHSLVGGLPGTGSGDCPPFVREYLEQHLQKIKGKGYLSHEYEIMPVEQIINSNTTSVVRVKGIVPAGVTKGARFDVDVFIPWSTQTTSLQGGILFPTELQQVVPGLTGRPLTGRVSALAAGELFINPFSLSSEKDQRVDPRRAVVLGGGMTRIDRSIQLALKEPDSRMAQNIQRRINSRFQTKDGEKIADAANRRVIEIKIPYDYRDRYQEFVQILMGLYLQDSGAFQELKIKELNEKASREDADFEAIALEWKGIGRPCLRYLSGYYSQIKGKRAFYAAQTALDLGERRAIDALILMAKDDQHPCQLKAVRTLGRAANDVKAGACLTALLDNKNPLVRLRAYESLQGIKCHRIESNNIAGKFKLDIIDSRSDGLVCIWTISEPRVVIFGRNLICRRNLFFETEDKSITINCGPQDDRLTISRQKIGGSDFVQINSPRMLPEFIINMALPTEKVKKNLPSGADLTFSQIVGILYNLCQQRVIPARFILLRTLEELIS